MMLYSRAVLPLGVGMAVHIHAPALSPVSTKEGRDQGSSMHRGTRKPWAVAL